MHTISVSQRELDIITDALEHRAGCSELAVVEDYVDSKELLALAERISEPLALPPSVFVFGGVKFDAYDPIFGSYPSFLEDYVGQKIGRRITVEEVLEIGKLAKLTRDNCVQ